MIKVEFFSIINKIFYNTQKFIALFVLFVILLNSFVPRNQEIRKNFMESFNCAVSAIECNFFDEYTKAIMGIVNNIMHNLLMTVDIKEMVSEQDKQGKEQKEEIPVNSSSEEMVIRERTEGANVFGYNIRLGTGYFSSMQIKDLSVEYDNIKGYSDKLVSSIGILFFILFGIIVIRIKDVMNNNIIKITQNREPAWL
jgi:hypothetical protein